MLVIYALLCGAMGFAMLKLPGSFLPTEDRAKSWCSTPCQQARRRSVLPKSAAVREWFLTKEKANTNVIFTIEGFSFSGSGQNAGMAFVSLKNWSERKGMKTPLRPLPCAPRRS